jgi:3-oxoadipate enol-lactonase
LPSVNVDGTRINYADEGSGSPVLFLHAFPLHSGMWQPQIDAFSDRYRLVAPDLMGFGASDAPDDVSAYSMARYADQVAGLLDALELDRVVVVGLSLGGYVAFALLDRHRSRLGALVLADTRPGSDSDEVLERRNNQQATVREKGTAPVIDAQVDTLLSDHTKEHRPEVVVEARRLMDNPPAGFIGALEAMKNRPDSTALLGTIDVPTLVLVGDRDKPSPPDVVRSMHEQIRGSRFAVLPNAGHLTNLEVPDAFNDSLGSFLDEL